MIPSSTFTQESRFQQAFPPVPSIPADPSLESQFDEARSAFAQAFNRTVDERAAQLVSRILSGLGPYQPGAPLRIVRIEGLNAPSLQVAITMAFSNANAGIQLVWVDSASNHPTTSPLGVSSFSNIGPSNNNNYVSRGVTLRATLHQHLTISEHGDTTSRASPALCTPFSPMAPLESSIPLTNPTSPLPGIFSDPFEFEIASPENQSPPEPVRTSSASQALIRSRPTQQPTNALTLQELQQLGDRSAIPEIGSLPRRRASPLEERALEILGPALAAARELRSDQPAIQWMVTINENDEPLLETMHRILSETSARINLIRIRGTITRNREGR